MTRSAALLSFLLLAAPAVHAAGPQPVGPRVADVRNETSTRLKRLVQQLGLSDAQKEDVRALLEREQRELAVVGADPALTPAQRQERKVAVTEEVWKKIALLLTPLQRERYEEMLAQGRARRDAMKAQQKAPAPPSPAPAEGKRLTLMPPLQ